MKASYFSKDIQEFLFLLFTHRVRYVLVGGEAVIYHGHARLTGDVDIFYENDDENVNRLFEALCDFWGGSIPDIPSPDVLKEKGAIFQFGFPPNRIDLLNQLDGVTFKEAWEGKVTEYMRVNNKKISIYYIGLKELIKNKKACGRPRDIEDLKFLIQQWKNLSSDDNGSEQ
ncbi:MAG: hypothetical protein GXO78_02570 [Calditrichaeota bacterium]|nr:hypothetical protein [Calditrichota bacterium]